MASLPDSCVALTIRSSADQPGACGQIARMPGSRFNSPIFGCAPIAA